MGLFDVTAMTMPLSRRVISDTTMSPASSPLTLSGLVASATRTAPKRGGRGGRGVLQR
jgi:hypothetical protein